MDLLRVSLEPAEGVFKVNGYSVALMGLCRLASRMAGQLEVARVDAAGDPSSELLEGDAYGRSRVRVILFGWSGIGLTTHWPGAAGARPEG